MKNFLQNVNTGLISLLIRLLSPGAGILIFNRILVIAPHPDDEILGLGGTILKLLKAGCKVHLVYLTDGEGSGVWHDTEEIARNRILLSEKVAESLGIENSNIYRLHLPDGSVPHRGQAGFEEAVSSIKEIISSVKPDAVFATHPLDYWPFDHVACAEIAREAINHSEYKPERWYYWVWAWYNIRPWKLSLNRLRKLRKVDISNHLARKNKLTDIYLKAYTPEGKPWCGNLPNPLLKTFSYPIEVVEKIF